MPYHNKKIHTDWNRGNQVFLISFVIIVWMLSFSLPVLANDTNDTVPLEIKIGQMIMVGFRGLAVNDHSPIIQDIRKRHIGGVILFDYDVPSQSPVRNITSGAQLKELTGELSQASTIPLFIAIDQEGGRVSRLKEKFGFPPSVSAHYLGSVNNLEITRRSAEQTAQTLSAHGINLNFAPVVDLNINPQNPVIGRLERSFSDSPDVVINHAVTLIDAFHKYSILSAVKHFPGHGSSTADSHKGFVDVTTTWKPKEIKPFRVIIESGKCDMIMTAHLFNATLDPQWPATLSPYILKRILRGNFHFDGVVISDDMQMKAITDSYSLETTIKRALIAGIDILLFANNSTYDEDIAERAVIIIKNLISDGSISVQRIDKSYDRIMKLKGRLPLRE